MVGSISSRNFAGIVNGHQNEIRELSINKRQIWNDKLVIKRSTQWTMPMIRLKKTKYIMHKTKGVNEWYTSMPIQSEHQV